MMKKVMLSALTSMILLAGCAENNQTQFGKQTTNTLGAGAGQAGETAVGTIAGGLLGNQLGQVLNESDRMRAERATRNALENGNSGQSVVWRNPDAPQTYGEVIPERSYTSPQGYNCREFTQKIYTDGQAKMGRGTACRDFDGTWKIQNG